MRETAALVAGQHKAHILRDELEALVEDVSVSSATGKSVGKGASEALDRIAGKRGRWVPFEKEKVR
jgi:hypothetical protein